MALVKPQDVADLNEKKEHLTNVLGAVSEENTKTSLEIADALDSLELSKQDAISDNLSNENSIKNLIDILNKKLSVPATAKSTYLIGDNKYTFGGEALFEIIDNSFLEANEDNWTVAGESYDQYVAQQNEQIDSEAEAAYQTAYGSISSELEQEAFAKSFDNIKASFADTAKKTNERTISENRYEFTNKLANDYITNNIDNSELLIRFEKEKAEREEVIEESFKRVNRKASILKNTHDDVASEKTDIEGDTDFLKAELKKVLGIDAEEEDVIVSNILQENKDSNLIFNAHDAIDLTRKSLFDLTIGGIIEKIKAACTKGETTIELTGDEVSGTQVYALLDAGYTVTHEELKSPGRNKSNVLFTIDWTFSTK
jgi:hypothetical protein